LLSVVPDQDNLLIQYCKTSWGCAAKSAFDPSEACGQTSEAYGMYYDV